MISIKNLNKYYGKQKSQYHALKNINLELPETGFICILGQSGSGKTTLMNIIGSLDNYDAGSLKFKGKELNSFTEEEVSKFRSENIGFIFQDYNVIEKLTVEENVNLSLNVQGKSSLEKVHDYLEIVELKGLEKRKINELSGGQKQRVAIARALIKEPEILLCDEATGNVDSNTSAIVANIIKKISKEKLVIFVTHDKDLALNYADRIINIKDGEIVSDDDNTENSCNFNMKFTKSFGTNVTEEEVVQVIEHAKKLNVELDLSINPSSSAVTTADMEVSNKLFNDETRKAKSAWKYFMYLAFDNIRQKKLRTFIILATFTLVLTITSVARTISTYTPADDYVAIMDKYQGLAYNLELSEEYYDETWEYWSIMYYYSGKFVHDKADESIGSENIVINYYTYFNFEDEFETNRYGTLIAKSPMYAVGSDFDFSRYNFVGTGPKNSNEIVLTSALARDLFGKKASSNEYIGLKYNAYGFGAPYEFTITGIIETDYSNTYIEKYFNGGNYSFSDYNSIEQQNEAHLGIFTHDEFYKYQYMTGNKSIDTMYYSSDLVSDSSYESASFISSNYFEYINSNPMIAGNNITSKNEILIPQDSFNNFCFEYDYDKYISTSELLTMLADNDAEVTSCYNNLIGKKVNFESFDSDWDSYYYSQEHLEKLGIFIDFDAIYPDGAEVVGISDDFSTGYVVHDDVMNEVNESTLYFDVITSYAPGIDTLNQVEKLVDNNFTITSDANWQAFNSVGAATELVNYFLTPKVVIILTVILALIPAFFLYLFNNISIDLKKKEVGILKSIGSSNNQVMSIFFLQAGLIGLISLIAASLGSIYIINIISSFMFRQAFEYGANGYVFTVDNFIYVFVLTFSICFVSLLLPYIKFNRKPPINIVKDL